MNDVMSLLCIFKLNEVKFYQKHASAFNKHVLVTDISEEHPDEIGLKLVSIKELLRKQKSDELPVDINEILMKGDLEEIIKSISERFRPTILDIVLNTVHSLLRIPKNFLRKACGL